MENFFFCQVVEFCMNRDILIPNMEETYILRGGCARRQPEHFTKERYYRVEIFRATIDTQLAEINLNQEIDLQISKQKRYVEWLRSTTRWISITKK
jgi:hypothetical protein